jgi:hypothetical protein
MSEVITTLCPECDGDGYFIHSGGADYFSSSLDIYVPDEAYRACERCGGYGEIELEPEGGREAVNTGDDLDDFDDEFDDIELPF